MSALYDETGAEPTVSTAGMAVLLGVSEGLLRAEIKRQGDGPFRIPDAWIQNGRRRARQYAVESGQDDMRGALEFWSSGGAEE